MGRDTGKDRDRPCRLDPHLCALVRTEAADLHVGGEANPHQAVALPGAAARLLGAQRGIIGDVERFRQRLGVLAAVVGQGGRRLIGELIGRDEIYAAHFGWVEVQLSGDEIDHALHVVGGLGPSCAAIGCNGGGIGKDTVDLDIDCGDVVNADGHPAGELGNDEDEGIGAHVGDHAHLQAGDAPVLAHGEGVVGDLPAAVRCGQEVLAAAFDPAEGKLIAHREAGKHHLFGIDADLHAEPAADLGRDDANGVLGNAQHAGELAAHEVRGLRAGPDREASGGRVGRGDDAATFHWHGGQTLAGDSLPDDAVGVGEGGISIADFAPPDLLGVAVHIVEEDSGVGLEGLLDVGDGGERVPVDEDLLGGVGGCGGVGGDYGCDALAGVEDLAGSEGEVGPLGVGLAVGGTDLEGKGHRLVAGCQVLAGHNGYDAVKSKRARGVDRADAGVGVGAADECDMVHVGKLHVADIGTAAGDQTGVLLALDLGAHVGCVCHRETSFRLKSPGFIVNYLNSDSTDSNDSYVSYS